MRIFQFLIMAMLVLSGCHKKAEVKKENIGNAELAYYIRGSGEPIIMIMGFRGTMAIWDPALLEILEKKYTLILFDNRGVGLSSDQEKGELTIPQMADDAAQLIKKLGVKKVHVLGWSMGSRIAMELALKYPDMVKTLILCSPNPGGQHQVARAINSYDEIISKKMTVKEGLSLIFPDSPEGNKASEAFVTRLRDAIITGTVPDDLNVSHEAVKRQIEALKLWDKDNGIYESLPNIKMPTLVAGGLSDTLDSPKNVQTVASRIPFAWTAYFPGAGHDFHSQDYKNFAELVTVFIETNKVMATSP